MMDHPETNNTNNSSSEVPGSSESSTSPNPNNPPTFSICSPSAYSPHTQGFPPSSGVSNPFAFKKPVLQFQPSSSQPVAAVTPTASTTDRDTPAAVSSTSPITSTANSSSGGNSGMETNLSATPAAASPSVLRPSRLESEVHNLLSKSTSSTSTDKKNDDEPNLTTADTNNKDTVVEEKGKDDDNKLNETSLDSNSNKNGVVVQEKTVDSSGDSSSTTTTGTSVTLTPNKVEMSTNVPTGFVFGSNIRDKVEISFQNVSTTKSNENGDSKSTSPESATANPSSSESLKRKWEDAPVTTGEENESNVLQTSCRLFSFNATTSTWIEKGRGLLRLNDRVDENESGVIHSRVILRTKGSLRVMLNTVVFPGMVVEKCGDKSIKITGMEEDIVKLFLIQCATADADTLFTALEYRVRALSASKAKENEAANNAGAGTQENKVTIHQGHFDSTTEKLSPKKPKVGD